MEYTYSYRLYEVAARVLRRCANGYHPRTDDVQLLRQHALPCQIGLNPAELAGTMIWRFQSITETFDSAA